MTLHEAPGLGCPSSTGAPGISGTTCFKPTAFLGNRDNKKKKTNHIPHEETTLTPSGFCPGLGVHYQTPD